MSWNLNISSETKREEPSATVQKEEQKPTAAPQQSSSARKEDLAKVVSVYGYKGVGKTYNSFGLCRPDQKILAISFDGVTEIIAKEFFSDYNITVFNAIKYPRYEWVESAEGGYYIESVEAGYKNLDELSQFLKGIKPKEYDAVLIDGMNFAEKLAEAYMRYKKGLKYDEKFADLNNWKIRNAQLNGIIERARRIAKDFVVFTVYLKEHVIKKEAGDVISSDERPSYVEDLSALAVVEIRIESKRVYSKSQGGPLSQNHFFAIIDSSKIKDIPTGAVYDITGKRLYEFVKL